MKHLVIPDTQVRDGIPLEHILATGNLIVKWRPDKIIVIGDWWDFPSLGTHNDRGNIFFHDKTYQQDYNAGVAAMELLLGPLADLQNKQRAGKHRVYSPELIFTLGNHEYRRNRLEDQSPKLAGALATPDEYLLSKEFTVHPFKEAVVHDGVSYCHLCPQTASAGSVGRAHLILARRHASWTVGHSQMLDYFVSPHHPRIQALIAGAFYQHDEDYKKGSNDHWRGIILKNNVKDGTYDPCFMEINNLIRDFT